MRFAVSLVLILASGISLAQTVPPPRQRTQAPQPPARIEGKFVDASRSTPLRGVDVALERVGQSSQILSATSDNEGRFIFRDVTPGHYQVHINKTGFISRRGHSILANNASLDIAPGETISDLTVPLWPAAVLRGKVLDPSGELLAGARVIALQVRRGKVRRG